MYLTIKPPCFLTTKHQVLQVRLEKKSILTFKAMYIIQNGSLVLGAKNCKCREILWSYFKHRFLAFTLFIQKEPTFGLFLAADGFLSFFKGTMLSLALAHHTTHLQESKKRGT